MKTNPLFYKKSNANRSKIAYAKKKLAWTLICLFSVIFMTTASVNNSCNAKQVTRDTVVSMSVLALVPFAAKVKGTLALNGHDETDAEFAARKGEAEDPEVFVKRVLNLINNKIDSVKALTDDIPELKKYKQELETLKENIKALKNDSELVNNLKEEIKKANLAIEGLKEGSNKNNSMKAQVYKFIADNAEKIKELKRAGHGVIEFKAVASMLTTSASNPDGIPELQGVQAAAPSNVNLRSAIVDSLVTSLPTSLASYPYTESIPKDGDYSFIGEAASKSQIDFKIETRYAAPKKVAAYMLLSEESVTDIPGLQAIAYDYLRKKHDLKRQNGILFGNGIGDELKGATSYGRSFVAGSMANAVDDPNFMDAINACITDMFTTHNYTDEMPYQANLVLVNPVDFFINLVSAKDGQGHPLYPTASLFNTVTIGGATIIPFEDIDAGKIFVADMSKYNLTNYVSYTVRIGWINDNFITNQFVIVGESRMHGFVKKLDEQAFIFDDIATVKAAIEA